MMICSPQPRAPTCVRCGVAMPITLHQSNSRYQRRACSSPCRWAARAISLKETFEERFWARVDIRDPGECWLWMGKVKSTSDHQHNYGMLRRDGKYALAHRVAFSLKNGPLTPGLSVMHTCDTPRCVNPAHLKLGTHLENMSDCWRKGRNAAVRRGEANNLTKLTANAVREIRAELAAGTSRKALAQKYGVGGSTITSIRYRKSWRHVDA